MTTRATENEQEAIDEPMLERLDDLTLVQTIVARNEEAPLPVSLDDL